MKRTPQNKAEVLRLISKGWTIVGETKEGTVLEGPRSLLGWILRRPKVRVIIKK